jgi:hypothetical protein
LKLVQQAPSVESYAARFLLAMGWCFADPTKRKEGFIGSKPHAEMLEAVEYVTGDSLVEFLEEVVGGDLVLDDQQMHKWLREKLSEVSMR